MTSSPAAARFPEPFVLRVAHFSLSLGLALALGFLISLSLLSASATLREFFSYLFLEDSSGVSFALNTTPTLTKLMSWTLGLGLIGLFLIAWRMRLRSWRLLLMLPQGIALFAMWWFFIQYLVLKSPSTVDLTLSARGTLNILMPGMVVLLLIIPFLFAWRMKLRSWRLLLILPMGAAMLATWWFLFQYLGEERIAPEKWLETIIRWGLIIIILPTALFLARRLQQRSWWWVGGGYLAVAPVITYLVVDDATLRHSTTIEEVAPAFPGAEKSYEVLMRYGKNHPLGRDFKAPMRIFKTEQPFYVSDIKKTEEWKAWLIACRGEIEADWADLAPVRAWWSELNAFDRIGDLTPARFDAEQFGYAPLRSYTQHAVAIAGLQALDGKGDDAFQTLLPLLEVSRKLEPSGRILVRLMIARIAQKMAIEAAGFVLDHAAVSPASRARFAAALTGGIGGESGARRLMAVDYCMSLDFLRETRIADHVTGLYGPQFLFYGIPERYLLNSLGPFLFNPNRTLNLYGDLTEQRQELAARREFEKFKTSDDRFFQDEARPRFKNLWGSFLLRQRSTSYFKILESYWNIEDARVALHERMIKM